MNKDKKYWCIVAQNRATGKREVISFPFQSKESANKSKVFINTTHKKSHKYFHSHLYPYKK